MAKQRKRGSGEQTTGLFVRIPVEEAEKLDRVAFEAKVPKREVIRTLISDQLDPEKMDVLWRFPAPPPYPGPAPAPSGPPLVPQVLMGRAESTVDEPSEVLTPAEAADLLQVDEAAVVALAEAGELPGRRIGEQWRFLRRAVLAWLGGATSAPAPGTDRPSPPPTE